MSEPQQPAQSEDAGTASSDGGASTSAGAESFLPTVEDMLDEAPKKDEVRGWRDVLLYSYARRGRPVSIDPSLRDQLSRADLGDRELRVARLLAGEEAGDLLPVRQMGRGIGLSNPDDAIIAKGAAIVATSWSAAHEAVVGAPPVDELFDRAARTQDHEDLVGRLLDLADAERLLSETAADSPLWPYARDAALALLWLVAERRGDPRRVMDVLRRRLWNQVPKSARSRSEAANLLESDDWASLAVVRRLAADREADLERQVNRLESELARSRSQAEAQTERAESAAARFHEAREHWERERQDLLRTAERELEEIEEKRNKAAAHARDLEERLQAQAAHSDFDHEQLRTSVLQRARRNAQQLEEAMAALSKDEPKLHVVDDRLDRTLASLHGLIDELSQEGTG